MRYAHTNIAAKDYKVLVQFYMDVFDCKIKPPERNLSGEWLDRATGLTSAKLQGVHLVLPGHGEKGPTLEIFTYETMVMQDPIMANYTGFTHLAFEVEDVEKTFEKELKMLRYFIIMRLQIRFCGIIFRDLKKDFSYEKSFFKCLDY